MADEFDQSTNICSNEKWWNDNSSSRLNKFDLISGSSSSSSTSTGLSSIGSFGACWPQDHRPDSVSISGSGGDSSGGGVLTDHHHHHHHHHSLMGLGLSSQPMDWNHPTTLLGKADQESSFRLMLQQQQQHHHHQQEDHLSSNANYQQETNPPSQFQWRSSAVESSTNRGFSLDDHQQPHSSNLSGGDGGLSISSNSFDQMVDNTGGGDVYGSNPSPSSILQGLFASSSSHQPQSSMEYHPNYAASYIDMNNSNSEVLLPHSHFMRNSPPKQQQPPAQNSQLHFSNNRQFWNAPAAATTASMMSGDHLRSSYLPSSLHQPQFSATPSFEEKPKPNTSVVKKSGSEVSMKRPRNETSSSPLPAFKVRKEKMGDRITALQQLVSPFGKTDTASVLSEALEYIKFLHEQVTVLSTAYLKSGASIHHHHQNSDKSKDHEGGPRQDLRSRGLCLVPVSTISPVNHETTVDFWTPTFGGTFR